MHSGDINEKCVMINSIVDTLTELNEVQSVRFLIEGEEVEGFKEETLNLKNEFVKAEF